jgi:hypothetical protein
VRVSVSLGRISDTGPVKDIPPFGRHGHIKNHLTTAAYYIGEVCAGTFVTATSQAGKLGARASALGFKKVATDEPVQNSAKPACEGAVVARPHSHVKGN